jgi:hypothetical protein
MKTKSNSQSAPARRSPWLAVVFTRRRLGEGGFFNSRVLVGFALCCLGVLLSLAGLSESVTGTPATTAQARTPGSWTATGSMTDVRYGHTATLLPNGKVLVAGGQGKGGGQGRGALKSAEMYDPASGLWTATGSMTTTRFFSTATLLPNGQVLVAGGYDNNLTDLSSAELYDPASGLWTATGSMTTARYDHTATLLPNGQVVVAGGASLASAELYDPAIGLWTATGSMTDVRTDDTATLLPNGQVLAAGGYILSSAELYDPASGLWTTTGSMTDVRYDYTATLLPNGQVLAAGGVGTYPYSPSAELYDPASGLWTATGSMTTTTARSDHTATLLPNGQVLVAGGFDEGDGSLSSAELYESPPGALELASAASVKGPFAIDLPLTGPPGVEDRSGGPNKKYTVVMTFNQNIVSLGSASSTCGGVQSIAIDSADAHKVRINLVNVTHGCNESTISVTADSITDDQGNVLDSASLGLGLLLGDVNGDRVVDHSQFIRQQQGTSLP